MVLILGISVKTLRSEYRFNYRYHKFRSFRTMFMSISAVQWRKTLSASNEFKAKLACLYSGAVFGLFWIPLRALEKAGIDALWITVVYFLITTICLVPIILLRWSHVKNGGLSLQVTCILSGGSLLLYSTSIVYTEVVRAMLLFILLRYGRYF